MLIIYSAKSKKRYLVLVGGFTALEDTSPPEKLHVTVISSKPKILAEHTCTGTKIPFEQ